MPCVFMRNGIDLKAKALLFETSCKKKRFLEGCRIKKRFISIWVMSAFSTRKTINPQNRGTNNPLNKNPIGEVHKRQV